MADTAGHLDWGLLLTGKRLPRASGVGPEAAAPEWLVSSRTETERDFDRILFATPTRRMGDKTQVFPLEKNESVRTRLTHSHEVANLARSLGTHLINSPLGDRIVAEALPRFGEAREREIRRAVPAMLSAIGLAHDLGNPPFGHQGEYAIRSWIARNANRIFKVPSVEPDRVGLVEAAHVHEDLEGFGEAHEQDFRNFEGNAQTLRTLTRLQVVKDDRGLNLTMGTLAALMKYTVGSADVRGDGAPHARKVGFFQSEAALVGLIRAEAGLADTSLRHPLTYLMEACDDIAYLIVDAEDAVKKQIVSFPDLVEWLANREGTEDDPVTRWVLGLARTGAKEARSSGLPPSELNDVCMQIFRTNAIGALVSTTIRGFELQYDAIMTTGLDKPLLASGAGAHLASAMKAFDREYAYRHRRVLEIELDGFNVIHGLMDLLWRGITERERYMEPGSERTSPFARYAYGRLSVNYRRVFEGPPPSTGSSAAGLPIRYRELQLLTDMMAGMTDQYAIDLYKELRAFHVGASSS